MILHTHNDTLLALSARLENSVPLITITIAGHTAETYVDRIVRELPGSSEPSPRRGVATKILSVIRAFAFRSVDKTRQVDHGIHLWYTLPENSLTGKAQLRRLFIEPDVSWGPMLGINDRPDIDAIVVRLIAAWRA